MFISHLAFKSFCKEAVIGEVDGGFRYKRGGHYLPPIRIHAVYFYGFAFCGMELFFAALCVCFVGWLGDDGHSASVCGDGTFEGGVRIELF